MLSNKDINFNDEQQILTLNGEKHSVLGDPSIPGDIEDLSERVLTLETEKISIYQPPNESVTVNGPYTDIAFTKPVEEGYIFYLIAAFAINTTAWNMSYINPVAGSIRIFTSDNTPVTNQVKTTWLKIPTAV